MHIQTPKVGDTAAVGGDISPSGLAMPPVDAETFERLVELFTEQAEALEEAGVDFFTVETQMSPAETRAAVLAVKSVSRRPVIASFTLSPSGRVIYGASLPAAALGLEPLGVEAVGVNCVGDLNLVTRSLRSLRRVTALRLLAKPNAGQPHVTDGETRYDMTPEALAEAAREFLAAGASLLGGCCGTTEAHIAALAALAESAEVETTPAPAEEWAASEYEVVDCASLSPEEIVPVEIDDDLEDSADEAAEDGAKLLHVAIRREEDIDALLESGIRTPLEVETASPALEKRFLRLYTGRPRLV